MDTKTYEELYTFHREGVLPSGLGHRARSNFKRKASRFSIQHGNLMYGEKRVLTKLTAFKELEKFHRKRGHVKREAFEANADVIYHCPGMRDICRRVVAKCSECQDVGLCLGTPRYNGPMVHLTIERGRIFRKKTGISSLEEVKLGK